MRVGIDILENELIHNLPGILDILLKDFTTDANIFWATDNYSFLGDKYSFDSQIFPELITGENGDVIMPRVQKDKILQLSRSKEMAEVFTPSWICNAQNNLIDTTWFGYEQEFNKEIVSNSGTKTWKTKTLKIAFPKNKTWQDYVKDTRLEISCGEAPYIVSRYDTTNGEFIPINNRVGLLDRKLRVVNENADSIEEWLLFAAQAFMSTYAFEWQGDSLLLAREAMLITFIENFNYKFNSEPDIKSIEEIATIVSWNVWQMDGIKGIIPRSCNVTEKISNDLFGNSEKKLERCKGCETNKIQAHNGIYCQIMDWNKKNESTGKNGLIVKFVDLIKK